MSNLKKEDQMEYLEINESRHHDDAKYNRAKERIAEVKKFYTNLMSYLGFIAFLAAINYFTNEWQYKWFLWAAFGWGIGIASQAVKVFGANLFLGNDWEERKIKEFMKEDNEYNKWN